MEQHDFLQGSPEWHQHRSTHFNASDAPAMLGISKYKTRSQLLHEMATGITPEIDASTQRRFDDGHRFEALARPLAEQIIGNKLYPVIGAEGKLSASFDGLTADDSTAFEHKTLNNSLREALSAGEIPEQYRAQMEQQLMLSGAGLCIFMASNWNDADELIEEMHQWYEIDTAMRERLLQGWTQFAIDLEEYKRKLAAGEIEQPKVSPKADTIMDLPALSVQATGMVTYSNLPEFKASAEAYIAAINTELMTDQHFADAEATVKFCKATEDTLEVTKKAILAQTSTIDEVIRTVDHIQAQLRDKRIMLKKLVDSEKEARKLAIVSKARKEFTEHIITLEDETRPIRLNVNSPNFGESVKGLKSLTSMQEKIDTTLRDAKFSADQVAKDVRAKLSWCEKNAAGMSALFPDLQAMMTMPMEDFTLTITGRIEKQKADESARMEAQRAAIQAEEERKAKAIADAEVAKAKAEQEVAAAAEEARIRAEEREAMQRRAAITDTNQSEAAPVAQLVSAVVIEHQDAIAAFMASRDFGKETGKVRAILVESGLNAGLERSFEEFWATTGGGDRELSVAAFKWATAIEREACAKECDDEKARRVFDASRDTAMVCSKLIRARSNDGGQEPRIARSPAP